MPSIVRSATFKIRSAVVASTFKVGGTVSSTFKTASPVVESTFKIQNSSVSSTFKISTGVISSTFGVNGAVLDDGVTYHTTEDCSKLVVVIDRLAFIAAQIQSVELIRFNSVQQYNMDIATVDGKVTLNANNIEDGIYTLVVLDTDVSVIIRMPLLIVCKLNKCFVEKNDSELERLDRTYSNQHNVTLDTRDTTWLELYVIYRGIIAAFRTEDYETAVALFEKSKEYCNCSCTCSSC